MNLYKIVFSHHAPKDSEAGFKCLLLAENEEQVFSFVDKKYNYEGWNDQVEDGGMFDIYDDDYNVVGTETFKEKILRIKGDINDDDYDFADAYYGITRFGWELIKEKADGDYTEFIELGIIYKFSV